MGGAFHVARERFRVASQIKGRLMIGLALRLRFDRTHRANCVYFLLSSSSTSSATLNHAGTAQIERTRDQRRARPAIGVRREHDIALCRQRVCQLDNLAVQPPPLMDHQHARERTVACAPSTLSPTIILDDIEAAMLGDA